MSITEQEAETLTDDRLQEMVELYETGASLAEVGDAFGVTRQAIYDRFKKSGIPIRNKHQAASVKRREVLQRVMAVEDELREKWMSGTTVAELASEYEIPYADVRRVASSAPIIRRPRQGVTTKYSDEELIQAVQKVAEEVGRPPGIQTYKDLYDGRKEGIDLPHAMTIVKRFGSWSNALVQAGYKPHRRPASALMGAQSVTDAEISSELWRVAGIVGHPPSEAEYREHSTGPSSGTVRMRYGGWLNALNAHFA